jgi:hypothetical protein
MSLARLLDDRGKRDEARATLAPIGAGDDEITEVPIRARALARRS